MTDLNPGVSLAGNWKYALDRDDSGVERGWAKGIAGEETLTWPGSLATNGIGDDVTVDTPFTGRILDRSYFTEARYAKYRQPGNIKFPCFLTPLKFYKGVAWYEKQFEVPVEWAGRQLHLELERVHFASDVWVNGVHAGRNDSLGTPHRTVLGSLRPGLHTLVIRIDNRLVVDVGEDAHSMTDHSQGSWNGVAGRIELSAKPACRISAVQVYPTAERNRVDVDIHWRNAEGVQSRAVEVEIAEKESGRVISHGFREVLELTGDAGKARVSVPLTENAKAWDEFDPALYVARARMSEEPGSGDTHEVEVTFGFRHFTAEGRRLMINGRRIYLRGTLECAVFPLTGYPPTDRQPWDRIMTIVKQHGLNHIRFHSWCPPRAAFQAADEAGVYFSVECSAWTYCGHNEDFDEWLYREADRMLAEYGNHPSFCMMLYGNEPYGENAGEFLGRWVEYCKARDNRRLYCSGTSIPLVPQSQFHVWMDPRIQHWDHNLQSRINKLPPESVTDCMPYTSQYPQPVISHETGQWCVYPNFAEIEKYKGVLRAGNLEIFRDFLQDSGQGDQARAFLEASGKLQVLCYKEDIEMALRTPEMGGFQLLDLHDFPGQGSALVGILDPFWDEKGYIRPEEWRRFCSRTVPLAKLPKRIFTAGELLECEVMISHFGERDLPAGDLDWAIIDSEETAYAGKLSAPAMAAGDLYSAGRITQLLDRETSARKLTIQVSVAGTQCSNDWDMFVYPETLDLTPATGVHVASHLDAFAQNHLASGGRVLLIPANYQVHGDERGQVPPGFSSIFWNTAWTNNQAPHTLGILCDPAHPALAHFPTDFHSNWQWWYPIQKGRAMILNGLPAELKPIVQVIDNWFTARRLGYVFECRLGGGSLLVCSVDCRYAGDDDPVSRQLYYSLLQYVGSNKFAPTEELTLEELNRVIAV